MSDWKSRAIKVPSDWKQRAKKVDLSTHENGISQGEAAIRGIAQGTLFGFPDEIEGLTKAAYEWIQHDPKGFWENYKHHQQKAHEKYKQAEEEHPLTYNVGLMGGAAIPALMSGPVGAFARGSRLGHMAAQGALQGLGSSEADLTKGEIGHAAADTALGGVAGAAVGQGIKYGASAFNNQIKKHLNPQALKQFARAKAVKQITGNNIDARRQITGHTTKGGSYTQGQKNIYKTGEDLLNEKIPARNTQSGKQEPILKTFSSVEDIAPLVEEARKKYGKKIGEISDKIDSTVKNSVNANNIAEKIQQLSEELPGTPRTNPLKKWLEEEVETYRNIGKFNFKEAHKYKQDYKHKVEPSDALVTSQDLRNNIKDIISHEMENTIERLGEKKPFELTQKQIVKGKLQDVPSPYQKDLDGLLAKYKNAKSKYQSFKNLSNAATVNAERIAKNRNFSPTDYTAGTLAAASKALIGGSLFDPVTLALGLGGAGAHRFIRQRGNSILARGSEALSDHLAEVLKTRPQLLGKYAQPLLQAASRGPQALAAANFILQQTQPDYRKLVLEPAEGEDNEKEEF